MLIELNFGSVLRSVVLVAAVAAATSGAVIAVSHRRGAGRDSIVDRIVAVWLIASLVAVAVLTLEPGPRGFDGTLPSQFNPLSRLSGPGARANFVLYLPVGFFASIFWRTRAQPLVWATALAFFVSLTIELAQWILPISRAAESHDMVFNTLGGLVGGLAGVLVMRSVREFGVDDG